jgi:hypothetical protein
MNANGSAAAATSGNPIIFPTTVFDSHGGYSAVTGRYSVKVPGYYQLHLVANGGSVSYFVYKNAVSVDAISFPDAGGYCTGSLLVQANAGDILDVRPNGNTSPSGSLSIARVSGPAQIAASESVNAVYKTAAAQSISNGGTAAIIVWDTKEFDSHNGMNTSTGVYTSQISGTYNVCSAIQYSRATVSITNNSLYDLAVYKNAAIVGYLDSVNFSSSGANTMGSIQLKGCRLVSAVAGDTVDIRTTNTNSGANAVLINSSAANYVSITRVGN